MKLASKFLGVTLAVGLGASTVFASATATFSPVGSTSVTAGTPISADISIAKNALSGFDFAFILIGSEDPIAGLSFGYDPDWSVAFSTVDPPDVNSMEHFGYTQDVLLVADNFGSAPISLSSLAVGTVQIDTTGMIPGNYDIRISNATDGVSELRLEGEGSGVGEPIEGSLNFTIVPEPATACIMLLGGFSVIRRVRK